jgi:hypothetical protein
MNMDGQDVRVDFNTLTDARNPISYALMISSTQPMIFSVISPSSTISLSTSTNLFKPLRPISEKCRHDLIFAPLHFRQLEVTIFGDRPLNLCPGFGCTICENRGNCPTSDWGVKG